MRNTGRRQCTDVASLQPFDYASCYNCCLFYAAVALWLGPLQPLTLAIASLYFWVDFFVKKYMILYMFSTKHESGGLFWRSLFNRTLIVTILGNAIVALLVMARGGLDQRWFMLAAIAPLPLLLAVFKWYCLRTFDDRIQYYCTTEQFQDARIRGSFPARNRHRQARVFLHPTLSEPLKVLNH